VLLDPESLFLVDDELDSVLDGDVDEESELEDSLFEPESPLEDELSFSLLVSLLDPFEERLSVL
jgi:hypothetical protein